MSRLLDRLRLMLGGREHAREPQRAPNAHAPATSPPKPPLGFSNPETDPTDLRAWLRLCETAAETGAHVSADALRAIAAVLGRERAGIPAAALEAIRHLAGLKHQATLAGQRFSSILQELRAPELVLLALLLDSDSDPDTWNGLFQQLRLRDQARETVRFLIANRSEMARVAFQRDAEDAEVIHRFAGVCGTEERLQLLTLTTLASLAGTGAGALTPWKEELLWRLYVDAYNDLTMAYGDEVIEDESALTAVQASRPSDIEEPELTSFVAGLPRRYLTMFDKEEIYRHVRLWRKIAPDDVHFSLNRAGDVWELTVVTLDKPFLFSNVCGVLAFFDMNILRGHALTSRENLVVDVFQFTDPNHVFDTEAGARGGFETLLSDVVGRRTDVADLLAGKAAPRAATGRQSPVIFFDNDSSRRYTVLELVADDAPGLLYRISRAVSRQGLDVELVLISTEGHKAIDVFHLHKRGVKLDDSDQLTLTEDLERTLAGQPAAPPAL